MEKAEKISVSDLSVGDWVCAEQLCGAHSKPRLTPPMKVVGLGDGAGGWVNLMIDPEQGDPFEFEPSEIRGVPITAEVLEKNGFLKNGEYNEWNIGTWETPDLIGVSLERPSIIVEHKGTRIFLDQAKYIHQLQHALRLAGVGKEIVL